MDELSVPSLRSIPSSFLVHRSSLAHCAHSHKGRVRRSARDDGTLYPTGAHVLSLHPFFLRYKPACSSFPFSPLQIPSRLRPQALRVRNDDIRSLPIPSLLPLPHLVVEPFCFFLPRYFNNLYGPIGLGVLLIGVFSGPCALTTRRWPPPRCSLELGAMASWHCCGVGGIDQLQLDHDRVRIEF